jgi:GAF domain-containing protein
MMTGAENTQHFQAEKIAGALHAGAGAAQAWQAFDAAFDSLYGHILFTALAYDADAQLLRRVFSNRPDINPIGGAKRVTASPWRARVLEQGTPYIGRDAADITAVFSDHPLLLSHGCESILNLPVRAGQAVIGSLNIMKGAHGFDRVDMAQALVIAQLAAAPLLLALQEMGAPPDAADLESV